MRKSTPSPKTFGFTSCAQVLAKLERERLRLGSAETLEDAADHATNAAVTAWHLSEWAWAALKKSVQIGDGFAWADKGGFQKWLTSVGCVELQHCQALANSFKHLGHDSNASDSDLRPQPGPAIGEWINSRGEKGTWVNSMGEPVYFTSGNDSTWWVVEGDKKISGQPAVQPSRKILAEFSRPLCHSIGDDFSTSPNSAISRPANHTEPRS